MDLSYKRELLAGGAFEDAKKRPGKIFTSMSVDDGEYYAAASTSNSTINWRRHLLMQVTDFVCASLFVVGMLGDDSLEVFNCRNLKLLRYLELMFSGKKVTLVLK